MDSSLDGETLTAIFHLRGIPEEIAVNREGVENMHLEYMWTVSIDLDGDANETSGQTDYTLDASYGARRASADTPATVRPFRTALRVGVYKHKHYPEKNETHLLEMPAGAHLDASHEENTLTLVGRVPGITDESSILFSTFDILLGQDVSLADPVDVRQQQFEGVDRGRHDNPHRRFSRHHATVAA